MTDFFNATQDLEIGNVVMRVCTCKGEAFCVNGSAFSLRSGSRDHVAHSELETRAPESVRFIRRGAHQLVVKQRHFEGIFRNAGLSGRLGPLVGSGKAVILPEKKPGC